MRTPRFYSLTHNWKCLRAVNQGKADAAICDGYLSEYLLGSNLRLNKLEIRSVLNDTHVIYMAVKAGYGCAVTRHSEQRAFGSERQDGE